MRKIEAYILIIFSGFIFASCHAGDSSENEKRQAFSGKELAPIEEKKSSVTNRQDSVLTPWTPIEVSRKGGEIAIACWGREYIFDQGILPSQIISQGESLLSRPVEMNLTIDGENVQWQPATIQVVKHNSSLVELKGSMISTGPHESITLQSEIRIEYDGLMEISLAVVNSKSAQPHSVSIRIPYEETKAPYYFKWVKNKRVGKHSGSIPDGEGMVMQSAYAPYFWIGDNNKGLFWFCQSKENWPNANRQNAVQYTRTGDELIQQFNLGATSKYTFGLQATPVKDLPADRREWRLSPAPNSNMVILWGSPGKPSSVKYHSWPEVVNPSIFKARVEEHHSRGQKVLSYASITRIAASCPVFQQNRSKWKEGDTKVKTKWGDLVYIDPSSGDYIKTIVQYFVDYMNKYDLDGYYLDGGGLYPYWKTPRGTPYYNILEYRDLQRALYTGLKAANPEAIIITHMSADMNIPVLAYTDVHLNGEQFRYNEKGKLAYKAKSSYMDAISLSQFKAEFLGKQWGFVPFFLPEVNPKDTGAIQPTQGLAALLLLHDVQPWAVNSNISVWKEMYQMLDAFGFESSQFIPYYGAQPPAETRLKDVYVSAYKKKNGEVLLVVSNLSGQDQSGEVSLNIPDLGISKLENIYSFANNTLTDHDGNSITVSLAPSSFKLYWLNKKNTR